MKKVSIIIPVYNNSLYLDECLNSVINQTYNVSLKKYYNIKKTYSNMIEKDISNLSDICTINDEKINKTVNIDELKKIFKKYFCRKYL